MAGKKNWSQFNERRGQSHAEIAVEFVETFPVGGTLTVDQFDAWLAAKGKLPAPSPEGRADKQSNEWKAHLMRRHEQKTALNKAGMHPRMHRTGHTPFEVVPISLTKYAVRVPEDEAFKGKLARKIQSITVHYRKWLDYQLQAPDYNNLVPEVKAMAEQCHISVENFGARANLDAGLLIKQLESLKTRLQQIGYAPVVHQIEDLSLDELIGEEDEEESQP